MSGENKQILAYLNSILRNKLTAINQYFLHARMLKHMGYLKLADYEYKSSIEHMKHSDMLVEHVLSLGGIPNLQELNKLMIGETVESMLQNDLVLSEAVMTIIHEALGEGLLNPATTDVLRKILEGQQEHIDFLHHQRSSLVKQKEKDIA